VDPLACLHVHVSILKGSDRQMCPERVGPYVYGQESCLKLLRGTPLLGEAHFAGSGRPPAGGAVINAARANVAVRTMVTESTVHPGANPPAAHQGWSVGSQPSNMLRVLAVGRPTCLARMLFLRFIGPYEVLRTIAKGAPPNVETVNVDVAPH